MGPGDAFDLTPDLQAAARAAMEAYRTGPLYTPPSLEGSLVRPSGGGVANWGGGAFDPETGVLYVKSSNVAGVQRLVRFDPQTTTNPFADPDDPDYVGYDADLGGRATFEGGIPLNKPPYAYIVAVDLNAGEVAWRVPFGRGSDRLRPSGAAGPRPAGTAGHAWRARRHRHQGRPGVRRRRRGRSLRLRQGDGSRDLVGAAAGAFDRHADDLPVRDRPPVRAHRHRVGGQPGAGGICAAGVGRRQRAGIIAAT